MYRVIQFAEEANRLEAQERLDFINDIGAGTGNLKQMARSKHMRKLERRAKESSANTGKGESGATVSEMTAIGIEVVEVGASG